MYSFQTTKGTFYIVERDDRWHVLFEDESLGSYHSARAAASDISGGHTFSAGRGIDPASLGIPEDLNEWHVVKTTQRGE